MSSALAMPSASFEGKYLHKDLYEQGAAYAFHICQNHPFIDGNKRTALATALVFLSLNGIELEDPNEETLRTHDGRRRKKGNQSLTLRQPSNGCISAKSERNRAPDLRLKGIVFLHNIYNSAVVNLIPRTPPFDPDSDFAGPYRYLFALIGMITFSLDFHDTNSPNPHGRLGGHCRW